MKGDEAIGRAVRVFITRRRMFERDLAPLAGISIAYLSLLLNGQRPISDDRLAAFAEALGCGVEEIKAEAEKIRRESR